MNNKKGNKSLVLGPVLRCCQSDCILPSGKIFSLSVSGEESFLGIEFGKTLDQVSVYGDNAVVLSFLPEFLDSPEKLDSDEISKNLKKYGWSEYHILLAKQGVERFKKLCQTSLKELICNQKVLGHYQISYRFR